MPDEPLSPRVHEAARLLHEHDGNHDTVAACMGVSRLTVARYAVIARANGLLPSKPTGPEAVVYPAVAAMLVRGASPEEVCLRLNLSRASFRVARRRALAKGLLPESRHWIAPPPATPYERWRYLRRKGASPPLGDMRKLLRDLAHEDVHRILGATRPDDASLVHTLYRLAMENLDAAHSRR